MIKRRFKASPVKVTGVAPDMQPFESSLEEDFYFLLRFRQGKDVVSFSRPTESVVWHDQAGKRRKYTPDVLVEFAASADAPNGAHMLCEIKPDFDDRDNPKARLPRDEDEQENRCKWLAATNFAVTRGWTFKVWRESDIRTPFLENAKFLMRPYERPGSDNGRERLLSLLREGGPAALGTLMSQAEPDLERRARLYPTLYTAIARGQIHADLSVRLSLKTVLSARDAA